MGANVGGLVGFLNYSSISNSYSTGSVTGGADANVGGLVGRNTDSSSVSNSYASGSVSLTEGSASDYTGG